MKKFLFINVLSLKLKELRKFEIQKTVDFKIIFQGKKKILKKKVSYLKELFKLNKKVSQDIWAVYNLKIVIFFYKTKICAIFLRENISIFFNFQMPIV